MLAGGQLGLLGLLGARLYQVQIVQGARYARLARDNSVSTRLIAPPRGRILDRDAAMLAGNRPHWQALLIAEQTPNPRLTLARFRRLVSLDAAEEARVLREINRHRRFIPVLVRDFLSWDEMARLSVHAPELPGILVDTGSTRVYPLGRMAAHAVGYVGPPGRSDIERAPMLALPGMRVGRAGIELEEEAVLRGRAGDSHLEVDASGRVIRELDRNEGASGADVTLTLHAELQQRLAERLAAERSASAVVMEVEHGEVLALASQPSFDPSLFDKGLTEAEWQAFVKDTSAPLLNKAIAGLYAPGSTFKPVVALAALKAGTITPETTFFCPGYLELGDRKFHCWAHWGHGTLNLTEALQQSCDVYFYHTAIVTGIDRIAAMARQLGIGSDLGLKLPGVRAGFVPTLAWARQRGLGWTMGDTAIHGIGQGFDLVTPLLLATLAARVASGRAVAPRLLRRIGAVPAHPARKWPALDVPKKGLAAVRQGLWEAINTPLGTAAASALDLPGMTMAGKTGSAEVFSVSAAENARGFRNRSLPWRLRPTALFLCYAPAEAPRLAAAVVVEHGNEGAEAAAPIARDIMVAALLEPRLASVTE